LLLAYDNVHVLKNNLHASSGVNAIDENLL
jgi:hypothetical protein